MQRAEDLSLSPFAAKEQLRLRSNRKAGDPAACLGEERSGTEVL
jgi:hypothetical protein